MVFFRVDPVLPAVEGGNSQVFLRTADPAIMNRQGRLTGGNLQPAVADDVKFSFNTPGQLKRQGQGLLLRSLGVESLGGFQGRQKPATGTGKIRENHRFGACQNHRGFPRAPEPDQFPGLPQGKIKTALPLFPGGHAGASVKNNDAAGAAAFGPGPLRISQGSGEQDEDQHLQKQVKIFLEIFSSLGGIPGIKKIPQHQGRNQALLPAAAVPVEQKQGNQEG